MIGPSDFAGRVGQTFTADTPHGPAELVLSECQLTGTDGDTGSFVLTFTSGPDMPIEQGSYPLSTAGFGPELIFLVPVRPAVYEAVFNRQQAG